MMGKMRFPGKNYGIHLITVKLPIAGIGVNVYLVEDPVPTLIDAPPADEACLKALREGMEPLGYAVEDIKRIIVTHPHFDHFGLARTIAEKSGAEAWVSGGGAHWVEDFEGERKNQEDYRRRFLLELGVEVPDIDYSMEFYDRASGFGQETKVSRRLKEGDEFTLASRVFAVAEVPGHSPWCLIIHDTDNTFAFTGDFLSEGVASNPLIQWIDIARPASSLRTYIFSLEKIRAMGLKMAFPVHGAIISRPSRFIDDSLIAIGKRRQAILAILKSGRQTPVAIARRLFPKLPRAGLYRAVSDVMSHLGVLEEEGLAKREEGIPVYFSSAGQ
jgi:glyoxylase-like metal-dependent hydrolase (beta-lactamase superfamily II)